MGEGEYIKTWMSGEMISESQALELAVRVGYQGWGKVAPNPMVGCVIVDRHHRFLAAGAHLEVGGPHAERVALSQIADPAALEGAWVYVTLEPCAHHGRTPACAKMLAELPIQGVTYLVEDPNPLVSGQGAGILRAAGKQVVRRDDQASGAELLAEIFLTNMRHRRPFVALKVATTLDGGMARRGKGGLWLTSASAREYVHYLRAGYDTIVVGANTVRLDDPQLNIRHPNFPGHRNRVLVLDPEAQAYRPDLALLACHHPEEVFWVVDEATTFADKDSAQAIYARRTAVGGFALVPLLARLYERGVTALFLEGGSEVYGAFLNQGLVDRLYLLMSPQINLGPETLFWTQAMREQSPLRLNHLRSQFVGEDMLITGRISPLGR